MDFAADSPNTIPRHRAMDYSNILCRTPLKYEDITQSSVEISAMADGDLHEVPAATLTEAPQEPAESAPATKDGEPHGSFSEEEQHDQDISIDISDIGTNIQGFSTYRSVFHDGSCIERLRTCLLELLAAGEKSKILKIISAAENNSADCSEAEGSDECMYLYCSCSLDESSDSSRETVIASPHVQRTMEASNSPLLQSNSGPQRRIPVSCVTRRSISLSSVSEQHDAPTATDPRWARKSFCNWLLESIHDSTVVEPNSAISASEHLSLDSTQHSEASRPCLQRPDVSEDVVHTPGKDSTQAALETRALPTKISSLMVSPFSDYQPSDDTKLLHREIDLLCHELHHKLSDEENPQKASESASSGTSRESLASSDVAEIRQTHSLNGEVKNETSSSRSGSDESTLLYPPESFTSETKKEKQLMSTTFSIPQPRPGSMQSAHYPSYTHASDNCARLPVVLSRLPVVSSRQSSPSTGPFRAPSASSQMGVSSQKSFTPSRHSPVAVRQSPVPSSLSSVSLHRATVLSAHRSSTSHSVVRLPRRSEPEGCSFLDQAVAPTVIPTVTTVSQSYITPVTTDTQTSGSYQLSSHQYTNSTTTATSSLCPSTSKRDTSLADHEDIQAGSLTMASTEKGHTVLSVTTLNPQHHRQPAAESTRLGSTSSLSQSHPLQTTAESTRVEPGVSSRHLKMKLKLTQPAFDRPQCWTATVWDNYHELRNISQIIIPSTVGEEPVRGEVGGSSAEQVQSRKTTSPASSCGSESNYDCGDEGKSGKQKKNQSMSSFKAKNESLRRCKAESLPAVEPLTASPKYSQPPGKKSHPPTPVTPRRDASKEKAANKPHTQPSISLPSDDLTADKGSKRQQPSDTQTSGSSGGSGTGQPESSRRRLPPKKRHCRNLLQRLTHNLRRCGRANVSANMSSANNTVCYLPAHPAREDNSVVSGSPSSVSRQAAPPYQSRSDATSVTPSTAGTLHISAGLTTLSDSDLDKTVAQLQTERGTDCIPRAEAELALCLDHFLHQPQHTHFYKMAAKKRKQMSKLATTCYVKAAGSRYGVTLTKTTLSRVPVARDIMWLHFS
ncbi:serine-rich adhesin for platelets-like [Littorina saxatilis]|uniref:Uncharacterized protein n=1 Tax=Littorina saxatilis TaxID=31220 RepID=A0AAN9BHR1_9CAEN